MTIGAHQPPSEMCLIKMIIVIMLGMSSSIANVGYRRKEGGISPHVYIFIAFVT